MRSFIRETHVTLTEIAQKCDVTKQAVGKWLSHGDMKLSQAERIMSSFDCTIRFRYDDSEKREHVARDIIDIDISRYPNACRLVRLAFVYDALKASGRSMKEIAEEIGVSTSTFTFAWQNDDAKLSIIYKVGCAIGKTTVFEIRQKADGTESQR